MGQSSLGALLEGLITVGLATVVLGGAVGVVLYQHELVTVLRRVRRRFSPAPDPPAGPPIERIASDVRRVRTELRALTPGLPMARRIGISRAYDDLLAGACRALDVPDTLSELPPGTDRDAERLRIEYELEEAGLRLSP